MLLHNHHFAINLISFSIIFIFNLNSSQTNGDVHINGLNVSFNGKFKITISHYFWTNSSVLTTDTDQTDPWVVRSRSSLFICLHIYIC